MHHPSQLLHVCCCVENMGPNHTLFTFNTTNAAGSSITLYEPMLLYSQFIARLLLILKLDYSNSATRPCYCVQNLGPCSLLLVHCSTLFSNYSDSSTGLCCCVYAGTKHGSKRHDFNIQHDQGPKFQQYFDPRFVFLVQSSTLFSDNSKLLLESYVVYSILVKNMNANHAQSFDIQHDDHKPKQCSCGPIF